MNCTALNGATHGLRDAKPASFVWPSTIPSPGGFRRIYRIINRDVLLFVQLPQCHKFYIPMIFQELLLSKLCEKRKNHSTEWSFFHLICKFLFLVLRFLSFFYVDDNISIHDDKGIQLWWSNLHGEREQSFVCFWWATEMTTQRRFILSGRPFRMEN